MADRLEKLIENAEQLISWLEAYGHGSEADPEFVRAMMVEIERLREEVKSYKDQREVSGLSLQDPPEHEEVRLYTAIAQLVKRCRITPQPYKHPEVIIWGDRVFRENPAFRGDYYECHAKFVSEPQSKFCGQEFLLHCEIQRGGFSSEGTFTIKTSAGGTLIGTANLQYLFDGEKKLLYDGGLLELLGTNGALSGFVTCRIIEVLADGVNVDLPSGEALFVSESELIEKFIPETEAAE